jgi:hypothetical protein
LAESQGWEKQGDPEPKIFHFLLKFKLESVAVRWGIEPPISSLSPYASIIRIRYRSLT